MCRSRSTVRCTRRTRASSFGMLGLSEGISGAAVTRVSFGLAGSVGTSGRVCTVSVGWLDAVRAAAWRFRRLAGGGQRQGLSGGGGFTQIGGAGAGPLLEVGDAHAGAGL